MKRLPMIAIAALASAACASPTETGLEGACAAGVLIDEAFYHAGTREASLPAGLVAGDRLGAVAVYDPTCDDVIEVDENGNSDPPNSMQNWESNVFPVGTPVYSLQDVPSTDRLAARLDSEWMLLFGPDFVGDGD